MLDAAKFACPYRRRELKSMNLLWTHRIIGRYVKLSRLKLSRVTGVWSSRIPAEMWLENTNRICANKSQPTFAPARCCKTLICISGSSTAIADKSDDFLVVSVSNTSVEPSLAVNIITARNQRTTMACENPNYSAHFKQKFKIKTSEHSCTRNTKSF
jgi:hypothetical protein